MKQKDNLWKITNAILLFLFSWLLLNGQTGVYLIECSQPLNLPKHVFTHFKYYVSMNRSMWVNRKRTK